MKSPSGIQGSFAWNFTQGALDLLQYFLKREVAYYGKYNMMGVQSGGNKIKKILLVKIAYRFFSSQNISSQGMLVEDQGIQFILDSIFWGVSVHGHFFKDYLTLFFNLFFWKSRMKGDVKEEFCGLGVVLFQNGGIETNFFLGGIGIQFPTQRFQAVDDVKASSFLRPLEGHVFPKMSQAFLLLILIPTAYVENKTTMDQTGMIDLLMYNSNSVGKLFTIYPNAILFLFGK